MMIWQRGVSLQLRHWSATALLVVAFVRLTDAYEAMRNDRDAAVDALEDNEKTLMSIGARLALAGIWVPDPKQYGAVFSQALSRARDIAERWHDNITLLSADSPQWANDRAEIETWPKEALREASRSIAPSGLLAQELASGRAVIAGWSWPEERRSGQ